MKNAGDKPDGRDGRRVARVELEVQRLVAQYLITHLKGEVDAIVTVAQVKMPSDLRTAKVYVSALNHSGNMSELIDELQDWAPEIQRFIGDHLKMRYCPKLTFYEDEMTKKVLKIESILKEISEENKSTSTNTENE